MNERNLGILQEILFREIEALQNGGNAQSANAKTKQIDAFTKLLKNGDKQAIEIIERINNENITPEDAFVLLSEYLTAKQ